MPNPFYKTMRVVNKKLCFLFNKELKMDKLNEPNEKFPATYMPNGQFDFIKTENFLKKNSW